MRGNSAIVKCSIPSFVADFVHVVAWADEDGKEYVSSNDYNGGTRKLVINLLLDSPSTYLNIPLTLI